MISGTPERVSTPVYLPLAIFAATALPHEQKLEMEVMVVLEAVIFLRQRLKTTN